VDYITGRGQWRPIRSDLPVKDSNGFWIVFNNGLEGTLWHPCHLAILDYGHTSVFVMDDLEGCVHMGCFGEGIHEGIGSFLTVDYPEYICFARQVNGLQPRRSFMLNPDV
jgi:hypothetical protein